MSVTFHSMDLVHSGPGCKCSHHLSKRSLIDIHSVLGDSGLYHGFGEDFPEPTKPLTSFSHHFPTFSSHLPVAPQGPKGPPLVPPGHRKGAAQHRLGRGHVVCEAAQLQGELRQGQGGLGRWRNQEGIYISDVSSSYVDNSYIDNSYI